MWLIFAYHAEDTERPVFLISCRNEEDNPGDGSAGHFGCGGGAQSSSTSTTTTAAVARLVDTSSARPTTTTSAAPATTTVALPVTTTVAVVPPIAPAAPTTTVAVAPPPAPDVIPADPPAPIHTAPQSSVSYASCADAKAVGAAPIYQGEPGYSTKLDRDQDGIACDK
ncbi:excalibur calcium-binding domain-containing protein [Rhodococcus opacus]|uniref:excalibur calcium-binding domain-containing protein n=1 Tax=Rhodococcus opacus TaxID=37919 RepID=UPI001F55B309|nr:excalibur calcium-binding domain-containing protein [Rhodococcus opacus]UNN04868.1 excalibur calcium-binding domain-containing protein [Rhodococcus opacus]